MIGHLRDGHAWMRLACALLERDVLAAAESDPDRAQAIALLDEQVDRARADLAGELVAEGVLAMIAGNAHLTSIEAEVLALCVAVDLDPALAATAQAITGSPTLTVAELARLLGPDALPALLPDAALVATGLLDVEGTGPLGTAGVAASRQLSWAMTGHLRFEVDLPPDAETLSVPPEYTGGQRRVLVSSPDRVRRLQAAVLATEGEMFVVTPPPADAAGWRALVRHATITGLGIVIDLGDEPLTPVARAEVTRAGHLNVALVSASPLALESLPRQSWHEVVAAPAAGTEEEWRSLFAGHPLPARVPTADQLHALAPVVESAPTPTAALHRLASGALLRHTRRVVPAVGWDDLILPATQEQQLRGLVDRYHARSLVTEEWGLAAFPSPGVVALFSGPSGTGKTMAAEVIAGEIGVDLFRVDLAALVSKYIGETEKNLEEVFSAAHAGSYVLLFDEADSLFGSRSEVSDARDRYANMEVSYLLQRLESYDGFVILTSNFQGNIDQAFLRRIHSTVSFTLAGAADRAAIWRRCLASAPVEDVDLDFVAEQFDLAGGAIRNASLTAAYFAAARREPIGMVDVLRAVSQEMNKLGRRIPESQFGPWAAAVAGR